MEVMAMRWFLRTLFALSILAMAAPMAAEAAGLKTATFAGGCF